MVPTFERRRNLHPLTLTIDADPAKAKAELIRAYKAGSFTHDGAAKELGVAESTFIRWVRRMDLWGELDKLRDAAEKQGKVLPGRRPARKNGRRRS